MPGMVSIRINGLKAGEKFGSGSGQRTHDARTGLVPRYIDETKSSQNRVLLGSMAPETLMESQHEQSARIRVYTKKAPRRDANFFISGVIGFSKEARNGVNNKPPDPLARELVEDFARKRDLKIIYLVRHSDESTTHYHFMTENIDTQGKAVMRTINRKALSELQDRAGEIFERIGLTRGVKKKERLENGEPYSKTIHRSVRQLHDNLPGEIKSLEEKRNQIQEKIAGFSSQAPEPKVIPVEIVKERHLLRTETVKAKVININDFERYKKSVAGRVASAETLLKGDVVPGQEFREVSQELTATKADLAQTRMNLSNTQKELVNTRGELQRAKKEIVVLRRIIDWVQEHFPRILEQFVATQEEEDKITPLGAPGG